MQDQEAYQTIVNQMKENYDDVIRFNIPDNDFIDEQKHIERRGKVWEYDVANFTRV